jgi:hypothetical protein
MSFTLVAAGKSETAKGEPKFFEFAASSVKAEDYPHLPSTSIGAGESKRNVPVIKISPASILVRQYLSVADAKASAISRGVTEERFDEVVLSLLNDAERNDTVKIVRARTTDAKILPTNAEELAKDAAEEVNIFAATERGAREGAKMKLDKLTELAKANANDPIALAAAIMAQLGIKA